MRNLLIHRVLIVSDYIDNHWIRCITMGDVLSEKNRLPVDNHPSRITFALSIGMIIWAFGGMPIYTLFHVNLPWFTFFIWPFWGNFIIYFAEAVLFITFLTVASWKKSTDCKPWQGWKLHVAAERTLLKICRRGYADKVNWAICVEIMLNTYLVSVSLQCYVEFSRKWERTTSIRIHYSLKKIPAYSGWKRRRSKIDSATISFLVLDGLLDFWA